MDNGRLEQLDSFQVFREQREESCRLCECDESENSHGHDSDGQAS